MTTSIARTPSAEDLFGIQQALHAYAGGIDMKDFDLFRSAFTDDVTASYGDQIGPFSGLDQLTAFMEVQHRDLDFSLHRITNHYLLEFDGETARMRTYVYATLVDDDHPEGGIFDVSGIYHDDLRLELEGWRIANKVFLHRRAEGNPNVFAFEAAAETLKD